jgi:DNA repair ATPase RecN
MGSPRSNPGGSYSDNKSVVSYYLDSMLAPLKTLNSKEGVLLLEEVKAPKIQGTIEERLQTLEDTTFKYGTMVERSLDAHDFMNLELEKMVESYEARIKDLEEKYAHTL